MNEAKLTKKCAEAIRNRGAFVTKIHGGPNQPAGLPDLVGCHKGFFFGIEMKMPGKEGTLTPRQQKKLRDIADADGYTAVCTSVSECEDLIDVIEVNGAS